MTLHCTIPSCNRRSQAGGYCYAHWGRVKRGADLNAPLNPYHAPAPAITRFLEKIDINENGCWIWVAAKNKKGYGIFSFDKRSMWAHRFSYQYFVDTIPSGLELDHLCRVHSCVNPEHLEAVSHLENVRRGKRGRLKDC